MHAFGQAPDSRTNQPACVLVVEDEFILGQEINALLEELHYRTLEVAHDPEEARAGIRRHRPDLVLLDISLDGDQLAGIRLAKELREKYQLPFIFLSSHSTADIVEKARATYAHGYLLKPVDRRDLYVAIETALYKSKYEEIVQAEREKSLQVAVINAMNQDTDWNEKFTYIARSLRGFVPFDLVAFTLATPNLPFRAFCVQHTGKEEFHPVQEENILSLARLTPAQWRSYFEELDCKEATIYNAGDFETYRKQFSLVEVMARLFRLESALTIPFLLDREGKFFITFYSRQPQTYETYHLDLTQRLAPSFSLSLEKLFAYEEIRQLSTQLQQEKEHLKEEIDQKVNVKEIIGESPAIGEVFEKIKKVAPTDTTVLITGETGTGKELVARAVHKNSTRSQGTLIKVNCAALPANLIESELFGHEKGAFTGALAQRKGKFEIAHGSTIFLDEIGEMPLEAQAKLLRVIQERTIERIGGNKIIKVDVRIIAATNRKLGDAVRNNKFREDLYYRLNVFPITLPPLRQRREDIPLLANFFLKKFSRKIGKRVDAVAPEAMRTLRQYDFPGNIRELEHIIERATINAQSALLYPEAPAGRAGTNHLPPPPAEQPIPTLQENERRLIIRALRYTEGRVRGKGGAAELLDIKPTTLEARMKKLGISKKVVIGG